MTVKVEIYTWASCPFCIRAKALLDFKDVSYTEYDIGGDNAARDKMKKRAGGASSLPQIFIDDIHYGGCNELFALDRKGELEKILN